MTNNSLDILQIRAIENKCLIFNIHWKERGMHAYREGFTYNEEISNTQMLIEYYKKCGLSSNEIQANIQMQSNHFQINVKKNQQFLEEMKKGLTMSLPKTFKNYELFNNIPIGSSPELATNTFLQFNSELDKAILVGHNLVSDEFLILVGEGILILYHFMLLNDKEKLIHALSVVAASFSTLINPEKLVFYKGFVEDYGKLLKEVRNHWDNFDYPAIIKSKCYNLIYFFIAHELGHLHYEHPSEHLDFKQKYYKSNSVELMKEWNKRRQIQEIQADLFAVELISAQMYHVDKERFSMQKVFNSFLDVHLFLLVSTSVGKMKNKGEYPEIIDRFMILSKKILGENWLQKEGETTNKRLLENLIFLSKINFERNYYTSKK